MLRPPPRSATGRAVRRLQENQRLIASWEILRVLLGTKRAAWLLGDGTPWWLLGGGWSLPHPSTGIIPPFQDTRLAPLQLLGLRILAAKE